MKTLTFTYTKKDGSISDRTLLATTTPSNKYGGIDVSELDVETADEFVTEYNALHDEFLGRVRALQVAYDVTHNYRQFLESGMSNITEI